MSYTHSTITSLTSENNTVASLLLWSKVLACKSSVISQPIQRITWEGGQPSHKVECSCKGIANLHGVVFGFPTPSEKWECGFFDQDSFIETLSNWAMTVVSGRARLGGIPCGVIAVETRSVECVIPADPANPDSETRVRGNPSTWSTMYWISCLPPPPLKK